MLLYIYIYVCVCKHMHIYVFIFIFFHSRTAPAIDDLDEVSDGLSKVHLAHCDAWGPKPAGNQGVLLIRIGFL